ncbi:hypothetical protein MMC16_007913 [Acarospora aff. strigata]|nr:hypothetical protein [Acarospora aff. strigata]
MLKGCCLPLLMLLKDQEHAADDGLVVSLQTVSLTFDDSPDASGHSDKVLDALKAAGVKASFFVNGNNFCDASQAPCKATLARITAEGHTIAHHTMNHRRAGDIQGKAQLANEFSSMNSLVGQRMTMLRMPFGEPFQAGGQAEVARVASVTSTFGVHVGWTFDGQDYNCGDNAACVTSGYSPFFNSGKTGLVLLHSVHGGTASALPAMLQLAKNKGYTFVSPEYYIQQIYGMNSAAVTAAFAACPKNGTAPAGK